MKVPSGATDFTPEDLAGLIPKISTREDLDEFEEANILDAFTWAIKSKKMPKEILSATGLLNLHKRMFSKTWKWAGLFRRRQTNIGTAPEKIQNELGALLGDVKFWIDNQTFPLQEIAVRFHHRLVAIHLFPNGNGRHARLTADLLLIYNGEKPLLWSRYRLSSNPREREIYIKALKIADTDGEYADLLKFALED